MIGKAGEKSIEIATVGPSWTEIQLEKREPHNAASTLERAKCFAVNAVIARAGLTTC